MSIARRLLKCLYPPQCRHCDGRGYHYVRGCGSAHREPCPVCHGVGTRPAKPKAGAGPANCNHAPSGPARRGGT